MNQNFSRGALYRREPRGQSKFVVSHRQDITRIETQTRAVKLSNRAFQNNVGIAPRCESIRAILLNGAPQ
jgi:hypothetical protein